MKVAILTQPLHTNYGGTLQAFALQYILREFGHEPVTINYRKIKPVVHPIRLVLSRIKQKIIEGRIVYPFSDEDIKKISKHHDKFINKHIKYTDAIYSVGELTDVINSGGFNAVVVGSDQTWRPRYSPRIDSFFLDFLSENKKIKKIAYASSFGTDDWEFTNEQTAKFSKLLKEFHSVSVRENSAVTLSSEHLGVSPEHVLDPTLLLDRKVYLELIKDVSSKGRGNVFNYVLDKSQEKKDVIQSVCKLLGKDFFATYPEHSEKEIRSIKNYAEYIYPPIEEWIRSFYDADFVITDSFHGTVFSIIFNKPFISIGNERRGKARFTSLLRMFNLENRLVSHASDINSELINESIDFDMVNSKLDEMKMQSLTFLKRSLSV
ncbi:TPA: polysaccharide pyruvyl transferase family protein [Klebsiella quasipneumoniae]|uniref:polysaccharide pyruvyl transferase family protein n=1 Tax=Klebsiella quasipneumoniae TaxID=1463165 RepID=UPI00249A80B3|nr:polysaccharide pyruvyl transferase family protein [Klebsiella quasipneumoniae]MDI3082057.1 polysaccharide pyruvyl transferase family protein [Klebsiella quasipneumoniae]HDE1940407.1 polysaccharide pyruvyl transferase family protein [Klebsiella quasipneumoniae]HDU5073316.1 polysaccharide pyruvyl transferase family protein [Klebsiella quasipneumoniae subsp. similipneumoniae]HEN5092919.1 polysaccharide pyruvyl transferase family protein [Klebsiella quasipneumoniae subsp. similipneumoniae]